MKPDRKKVERRADQLGDGGSSDAVRAVGSDLDWRAWCFVTGDLDEVQSLEFQKRLEAEPDVAMAVGRAVELYGCCEAGLSGVETISNGMVESVLAEHGAGNGRVRLLDKTMESQPAARRWRLTAILSMAAIVLVAVSVVARWNSEAVIRAHDEAMLAALWSVEMDQNDPWGFASLMDEDFDTLLAVDGDLPEPGEADGQGWIFAAAVALDGLDFDSGVDDEQIF